MVSPRWSIYRKCDLARREIETASRASTIDMRMVARIADPVANRRIVAPGTSPQYSDHAGVAGLRRWVDMGKLAGSLAHELSQPLNAIENLLETCAVLMQAGVTSSKELLSLIRQAGSQSERASQLIVHMTGLLRDGQRRIERCELRGVLMAAVELFRPTLVRNGIVMELLLGDGPLYADVCRVEIEQVMINLLQNAVDAMLEQPAARRDIRLEISADADGWVTVALADTGIGFPAGAADRMFEPF